MHYILLVLLATTAQADEIAYIAGTNPAERLATAPTTLEVHHDVAWYSSALTGVAQPYPASLHFLENQGNWFSPFTHAGMTPPYDLRGWHTDK
jgi:hypothetical protein